MSMTSRLEFYDICHFFDRQMTTNDGQQILWSTFDLSFDHRQLTDFIVATLKVGLNEINVILFVFSFSSFLDC